MEEPTRHISLIDLHVFQCCLEYFDMLLSYPLLIPGIELCTEDLCSLKHVMVGVEVQQRRIIP